MVGGKVYYRDLHAKLDLHVSGDALVAGSARSA